MWIDNIKEWTDKSLGETQRMAHNRVQEVLVVDKQRGAEEWNIWLEEYEIYECSKELDFKVQIGIFLNIIGSEGVKIFKNFKEEIKIKIEETDKKLPGKLLKYSELCCPMVVATKNQTER